MNRTRKNGEGTYGTKVINGIKYEFYRDANKKYTYAKTSAELQRKLKEKKKNADAVAKESLRGDKKAVFSDLCLEWLPTKKASLSPRVYDDYEKTIERYISKNGGGYDIGNKQIASITPQMFTDFFEELSKKYSKSSIDKIWVVAKGALEYGMDEEYIPAAFRMKKIQRPSEYMVAVKKKEVPFVTLEDMDIIYNECLIPNKYGNTSKLLVFIMYSGLRINEAIALTWNRVSPDYSNVTVAANNSKVLARDKDGNPIKREDGNYQYTTILKAPKTKKGIRNVPIDPRGVEVLRYFDNYWDHKDTDRVFVTSNHTPMTEENARRSLGKVLKHTGLSETGYTLHSLRHGYGTALITNGVDPKTVSELMGHADISTTLNIYVGVSDESKRKAVLETFTQPAMRIE